MLSKWRPRRSSDERRVATPFGSFGFAPKQAPPAAAGKPAGAAAGRTFTVTASAADGYGPPAATPPAYPAQRCQHAHMPLNPVNAYVEVCTQESCCCVLTGDCVARGRRSSLSGCLEKRKSAPPAVSAARSACARAQVSRTAASLLAAELGQPERGARACWPEDTMRVPDCWPDTNAHA